MFSLFNKKPSILNEISAFSGTFTRFLMTHNIKFEYDDYVMALRTHLLMKGYRWKDINDVVNNELVPALVNKINYEKQHCEQSK